MDINAVILRPVYKNKCVNLHEKGVFTPVRPLSGALDGSDDGRDEDGSDYDTDTDGGADGRDYDGGDGNRDYDGSDQCRIKNRVAQ
ncbi:hypothetical protein DPMN_081519 [Dreissena polymorpha]|uniref:Uncharacterized protein n=1 Tax=Dreissena polymorpha TaxID=45954 RepID=A0A9D3Y926_DREPO|nr:hypothetical protein DPMN_081519 [Dreissena polymorpha]